MPDAGMRERVTYELRLGLSGLRKEALLYSQAWSRTYI